VNFVLKTSFGADVEAVALEVYADEIAVGMYFCQPDSVLAFAAGEFQGDGVVVAEEMAPLAGHAFGILKDVREGFNRFEADKLFLTHTRQR